MTNKDLEAVFSSRSDDWATPKIIYDYLKNKYGVRKEEWFDPCPLYAIENNYDGLAIDWNATHIFINPPYSNIKGFISKAIDYHKWVTLVSDDYPEVIPTIVLLIPARTDTKYYKDLFRYGCEFNFIESRLKFSNSKYASTFPSVLIELTGNKNEINYIEKNELLQCDTNVTKCNGEKELEKDIELMKKEKESYISSISNNHTTDFSVNPNKIITRELIGWKIT